MDTGSRNAKGDSSPPSLADITPFVPHLSAGQV